MSSLCFQIVFSGSIETANLILDGMKSAIITDFESVAGVVKPVINSGNVGISMLIQGVHSAESAIGDLMRHFPQANFRILDSCFMTQLENQDLQVLKIEF